MSENRQPENPPAFPVSTGDPGAPYQDGHHTAQFPGMSLRDYFAAEIIPELIRITDQRLKDTSCDWSSNDVKDTCLGSFEWADAMLAARAATGKGVEGE